MAAIERKDHAYSSQLVADSLMWLGGNGSPRTLDASEIEPAKSAVEFAANMMGNIEIPPNNDRTVFVELAALVLDAAESFEEAIASRSRPEDERQELEEILYRIEDVAETATLAADEEFSALLDSEIRGFLNEQSTT